jgi:hypothetical protein
VIIIKLEDFHVSVYSVSEYFCWIKIIGYAAGEFVANRQMGGKSPGFAGGGGGSNSGILYSAVMMPC